MVSHLLDLKWHECLCTNNRSRSSDARQKGKGGWMQVLYFEFAVLYFPFRRTSAIRTQNWPTRQARISGPAELAKVLPGGHGESCRSKIGRHDPCGLRFGQSHFT